MGPVILMGPSKYNSLTRSTTIEKTAIEGIDFLKSAQKGLLLRVQGLVEDKPAVQRDNSMVSTAKEAERLFNGNKLHADAKTRGQQKEKRLQLAENKKRLALAEIRTDSSVEPPKKKLKLRKDTTMKATAEESKYYIPSKKLSSTRQRTRQARATKSSHYSRGTTAIARTLEDAKNFLCSGGGGIKSPFEDVVTEMNQLLEDMKKSSTK